MKCALCNGRLVKKLGPIEFNSKAIGKVSVPDLEFFECENCADKILASEESDKAIDFIAEKERKAISNLPIKDFITANEVSKILGITKQAFSKHPKIKRGLIYFVKIGNRKFYNRKSVELFKEKGNGKYLLLKHEIHYIRPKKEFVQHDQIMRKFYFIQEPRPRKKYYGATSLIDFSPYNKYEPEKIPRMRRA